MQSIINFNDPFAAAIAANTTQQQEINETFSQIAQRLNAVCKSLGGISGLTPEMKEAIKEMGEEGKIIPVTLTGYKNVRKQRITGDLVLPITWAAIGLPVKGSSNYNEIIRDNNLKTGDAAKCRLVYFIPETGSPMFVATFAE